jgi:hypothetical protein
MWSLLISHDSFSNLVLVNSMYGFVNVNLSGCGVKLNFLYFDKNLTHYVKTSNTIQMKHCIFNLNKFYKLFH